MKTFTALTKRFGYVNPNIEKNFTLEPVRNSEYKLFHFDKYISSEDAIKEMEKEGFVPCTLSELLHWGDWNEKDSVVALGSVAGVVGYRNVPELYSGGSGRGLSLHWCDGDWRPLCRFLALRSVSKPLDSGTLDALELRIAALEKWARGFSN